MRLSLQIVPLISIAICLIFLIEAVNVRFAQILFICVIAFLAYRFTWQPIIIFLGTVIIFLLMLTNLVQVNIYMSGLVPLLTLFSGQFLFQEFHENPHRFVKGILATWMFILAYLIVSLLLFGNIASNLDGSHNHVNNLLLPFFIFSSCVMLKNDDRSVNYSRKNKKLFSTYIFMSMITILISIFLTGRTGLVLGVSGLIVITVFMSRKSKLFNIIFVYLTYLAIINFDEIYLFLEMFSGGVIKLIRFGVQEDIRYDILKEWISMFSNINTWFGIPENYFLNLFGVGSHNSFVQIYEVLGMFGLMFFGFITLYSTLSFLLRGRYLLLILFTMFIFRMFSDSLFNSIGMLTTFWFLVFCSTSDQFKRSILRKSATASIQSKL
ncbi:hypothetical protein N9Y24_05105 [Gammaproteobacteria bacterium]|nr:hypothetical protein [Gammaproteobacteria bacterium]